MKLIHSFITVFKWFAEDGSSDAVVGDDDSTIKNLLYPISMKSG